MKLEKPEHNRPADANVRRKVEPVICYPVNTLHPADIAGYRASRDGWHKTAEVLIPPREARCFEIPAGHFFRIVSVDGPQVGDLNLWNAHDPAERFYSGKTRALHGTHLSTGDRMWSNLPYLRPMATITEDTLDWYGFDQYGGSVHDVIGTRCDPYTHRLLSGGPCFSAILSLGVWHYFCQHPHAARPSLGCQTTPPSASSKRCTAIPSDPAACTATHGNPVMCWCGTTAAPCTAQTMPKLAATGCCTAG